MPDHSTQDEDTEMTDYRALCAELADALDHNRQCLMDDRSLTHPLADRARAVLARWGRPAPVPAEGEVAELVAWLRDRAESTSLAHNALRITRAADLLEQRHPAPVPVSERLPGPEDCDAEGFCWWFSPADPAAGTFGVAACWVLRKPEPEDDFRTHWLPATALPLPQGEVEP